MFHQNKNLKLCLVQLAHFSFLQSSFDVFQHQLAQPKVSFYSYSFKFSQRNMNSNSYW